MAKSEEKIIVGRFGAAFGVNGRIKVISFTDPPDNILNFKPWLIQQKNQWQAITPVTGKMHGKFVLVQLPDCEDRDQAQTYTNKDIAILQDQLPKLPKGQFYWRELEGLTVTNKEGRDLGIVDHVLGTGANDVLVIMQGKKERLIPYIKDVVINVDLTQKRMVVDWDSDF